MKFPLLFSWLLLVQVLTSNPLIVKDTLEILQNLFSHSLPTSNNNNNNDKVDIYQSEQTFTPAPKDQSKSFKFQHYKYPDHVLDIKEPHICDPSVLQYSGYLRVNGTRNLFFWFFESRSSPSTDPLMLYESGGPGTSSMLHVLGDLGPCKLEDHNNTRLNPFSWNEQTNIIFLDQPVGVGFSYSKDRVKNSRDAAKDSKIFLELFLEAFTKYRELPLYLYGVSYGGHFVPALAQEILEEGDNTSLRLKGIGIGNGLIDPLTQ